MERAYYSAPIEKFLNQSEKSILGDLSNNNQFELGLLQKETWLAEIRILKSVLKDYVGGHVVFEYTIPRIGARIDTIVFYCGYIFLLEFKVGEKQYPKSAIDQVVDYALDLKYFHEQSQKKCLFPILVSTKGNIINNTIAMHKHDIYKPILCNEQTLLTEMNRIIENISGLPNVDVNQWLESEYKPTPTIIEAAQALYRGHDVHDISHSDASAINISVTTATIDRIMADSKKDKRKSICFVTGVPGAGKTLVGLNIANTRHKFEVGDEEHAVFLSGNEPLVTVLKEALTRDGNEKRIARCKSCKYEGKKNKDACQVCEFNMTKADIKRKTNGFIQIIHHFRDQSLKSDKPPIDKIVIFDEAQRAWSTKKLQVFMKDKKGKFDFAMSEPEFLVDYMDRHEDWTTIICLVGGGQEIHDGEAGIVEWFKALNRRFNNWDVYLSNKMKDPEYFQNKSPDSLLGNIKNVKFLDELHLSVSMRSFRSEVVSDLVKAIIDVDVKEATRLYEIVKEKYPIVLTRDIEQAKCWVQEKAAGSERYGVIASSGAKRLRSEGIIVPKDIEIEKWFLNSKDDVNSSYYMEVAASEFKIQGLEIDYALMAWEADYRFENGRFAYYNFKGSKWTRVNQEQQQIYLKNSYRVLLTRARQGLVIYVPKGNAEDITRIPAFYDGTYEYLKAIGIEEI